MSKLCLLCCDSFLLEFQASLDQDGWEDVVIAGFPARCGRPPLIWEQVYERLPEECSQVVVLGLACMAGLDEPPPGFPPIKRITKAQCFHFIAGEQMVNEAIAEGAYLMTPVWLKHWRQQIENLGFEPQQAGEFFRDVAKELILLDTGLEADSALWLAELQAVTTLPARRMVVGLDHARQTLARIVLEWQLAQTQQSLQQQKRRYGVELANHVAAMDMLIPLAKTQHESEVISSIQELFQMLFAPSGFHYLRIENGIVDPHPDVPPEIREVLQHFQQDHAWMNDGNGFMLRIRSGHDDLGLIAVDRLAFPEYREHYLNLALAITGVCGLAIANARNRQKLLQAEKMASLSIMVAGVAHDINTPLGVSLTAVSTLQDNASRLTAKFAARSMTQSDLDNYLKRAEETTALIRLNLERIGRLTDTFRQVTLNAKPAEKHGFRIRQCLDDVIVSMGPQLSHERVSLNVSCEPELEIEGLAEDWVSIFSNLIQNSIKHGFRDRDHGAIDIRITLHAKALVVEYQDDGHGLTSEALAHLFDPFFTTNLQQGMGLGMYLVYNLITHRMGGSIRCQSQPGQGAHFHIMIPI